jgi:hypothetical protein
MVRALYHKVLLIARHKPILERSPHPGQLLVTLNASSLLELSFMLIQFHRALAVLALLLSCAGAASAQIIVDQENGHKTVLCLVDSLSSSLKDCGLQSDWYTYTFVGSISAITSIANDEKKLQIVPEEVFYGKPPYPLIVRTSQAACLPELAVGDHWLFRLRKENGKPIVLDLGSDSSPVAGAQEQIETFRRLAALGDLGIVRGRVLRGSWFEDNAKPVPGARVVAYRESDNMPFVTTTGAGGRYEFQPLPPGKYKLTVDPIGSFQPDDDAVDVSGGSCSDVTLSRSPHAQLSGHVRRSDGSPVPGVAVLIESRGESWWTTTTDADGYFQKDLLKPGKYVVGINLPGSPALKYEGAGGPPPAVSLYYPGVQSHSAALPVKLATDEKREDIDFILTTP